jgi:dolichol kinase
MSCLEVAVASLFYQFTLYVAIRLAHRGFTLGELGILAFGGTVLFLELVNVTIARVSSVI